MQAEVLEVQGLILAI